MVNFDDLENFDIDDLPLNTKLEAVFGGTKELYYFSKDIVIPATQALISPNPNEKAITESYQRMFLLIESAVFLDKLRSLQTTAMITRSLFELLLDLKLLCSDEGGVWANKYHAFPEIEKFRVATNQAEFDQENPGILPNDIKIKKEYIDNSERKEQVKNNNLSYWEEARRGGPRKLPHWTGIDIKSRAKKFGPNYEGMYLEICPSLSWYVHSGSTGFVGIGEDGLNSLFGICHRNIQIVYIEATRICSKALEIDKAVRPLLNDSLDNVLDKINLAPGRILVEEQIKILKEAKNL